MRADHVAVAGALTVPMIGPRSRAVGAPQWIGWRSGPRWPGCDVSRIWLSLFVDMQIAPQKQKALSGRPGRVASKKQYNACSDFVEGRARGQNTATFQKTR